MRLLAVVVTLADVALAVAAVVLVFASDDVSVIVTGDLLMVVACLVAMPVLHYWIEGPHV